MLNCLYLNIATREKCFGIIKTYVCVKTNSDTSDICMCQNNVGGIILSSRLHEKSIFMNGINVLGDSDFESQ